MSYEFKLKIPSLDEISSHLQWFSAKADELVGKMFSDREDPPGWTPEEEKKYQAAIKKLEAEPESGMRTAILKLLTDPQYGRELYRDAVRRGWIE